MTDFDLDETPAAADALFFDRDGTPLSAREFLAKQADPAYRFVGRDTVGTKTVITAWMGTDQWDAEEGRRYIFGTIVHDSVTSSYSREQFSSSEEEALSTHAATLADLRAPE